MSEMLTIYEDEDALKLLENISDDPNDPSISTRYFTLYSLLPDLRDKIVLDLPCGLGKQARNFILRSCAKKVIAVDIVAKQLELAKEKDSVLGIVPGQIEYVCHDAKEPKELAESMCDVCVSIHLFCFAEDYSQLVKMCHCIYLNLKPGGVCYALICSLSRDDQLVQKFESFDGVTILHVESWHGDIYRPRRFHYLWQGLDINVCVWEYDAVCSALKAVGFSSIKLHPYKKSPSYKGSVDLDLFISILQGSIIVTKKQ